MPTEPNSAAEHFSEVAGAYAQHRPSYPAQLARTLAELAPARRHALDVGCGSGQLSVQLARHFELVTATDVSAQQLARAPHHAQVRYLCEAAESMSAAPDSIDLIAAAQSAHWFDLQGFYREARRIAVADAVVALISYGVMDLEGAINACFKRFYWSQVHEFWPTQRHHVESGYAEIEFPFTEVTIAPSCIEREWNLQQLLGYVRTWTATRRAQKSGAAKLVTAFEDDMSRLWGDAQQTRRVRWPIAVRAGRVSK